MGLQRAIVARRHKALRGERVRMMVDGPSPEHDLVLEGRLEGQAPEIDPVVYFTDCDPSAHAPGDLVEAEIVGSRDYDLLARPAEPAIGR
jgi:ribosomal protein S12 methylthiotransferase